MLLSKFSKVIDQSGYRLSTAVKLMESYHYKKVLERGFGLIRDSIDKKIVTRKKHIRSSYMKIEFFDGSINVKPTYSKMKKVINNGKQEKLF
jgi:exodeoxyribonuclease VII large subunit